MLMTVTAVRSALQSCPTAKAAATAYLRPAPALPKDQRANLLRMHSGEGGGVFKV